MCVDADNRLTQGIAEYEIIETTKAELTMPDKLDPTDSKSWQHHLYRSARVLQAAGVSECSWRAIFLAFEPSLPKEYELCICDK